MSTRMSPCDCHCEIEIEVVSVKVDRVYPGGTNVHHAQAIKSLTPAHERLYNHAGAIKGAQAERRLQERESELTRAS
jgi:hypothetical protein